MTAGPPLTPEDTIAGRVVKTGEVHPETQDFSQPKHSIMEAELFKPNTNTVIRGRADYGHRLHNQTSPK